MRKRMRRPANSITPTIHACPWLVALIEQLAGDKLLLICRSQAKVLALEEALRTRSGVKVARFHEGMSILQRDRNGAFFAEADGARVLLCSEIGSEGRNFQFAHHLILWDLPLDPDLLEQRIGRLDRIGQRHDIVIHAAAFGGSAQHALLRWYHEGLDALRSSPSDGREILRRYGARILSEAERHAHGGEDPDAEIDSLIAETAATHRELSELVNTGRDRLLELASERQAREQRLAGALREQDADTSADDFVLALFEQFGIDGEETGPRTCVLDPEYLSTDGFPGLKDGRSRSRSSARLRSHAKSCRCCASIIRWYSARSTCCSKASKATPRCSSMRHCRRVPPCSNACSRSNASPTATSTSAASCHHCRCARSSTRA